MLAPILLTAVALRGGLLMWPWGLVTASLAAWLCYDATIGLGPHLGLAADTQAVIANSFRMLATFLNLSAGLAQRFVMDDARARSRPKNAAA